MQREIRTYQGKHIGLEQIKKMKIIVKEIYPTEIYNKYYRKVNSYKDLKKNYQIGQGEVFLVLGEDWFLCYKMTKNTIKILEWVALSDKAVEIQRTIEMLSTFKNILIQNKKKKFIASMRHSSSYKLYQKMIEKGYFKELYHDYAIDVAIPKKIYNEVFKDASKEILLKEKNTVYQSYFQYVFHYTEFITTEKFMKKYETNHPEKTLQKRYN